MVSAHEAVTERQARRLTEAEGGAEVGGGAVADLIGRLGARIGLDAITRLHPGESHLPEKGAVVQAAAFSDPVTWGSGGPERPLTLFPVELVEAEDVPHPPARFRWRGRWHEAARAKGPERIAPEWWLDAAEWRTGTRDYWQVTTRGGDRLWLCYAHGAAKSGGWFCHGAFG